MLFKTNIEKAFDLDVYRSERMEDAIQLWRDMQNGIPSWCIEDPDVRTIRFGNTIARELAALVTQNIDVKVDPAYGTDRSKADDLQDALDTVFLHSCQEQVEKMVRMGGIMAKWNGTGLDYIPPDRFLVTDYTSDGKILGVVFFTYYSEKKQFYTRAEWHRWDKEQEDGSLYRISNKAFVSDDIKDIGRPISLEKTRWANIEPEVEFHGLEKPLFVYLRNPYSNTIDPDSPLGVSCFAECTEELRWLDIAMSTLGVETEDSKPIMFVDNSTIQYAKDHMIRLPRFVRGMDMGVTPENTVNQWQPQLQIESRKEGINFFLSIIGYKCGFEPGYFVFDGQTISVATATQVEATERRTIHTVMSYRALFDRPSSNGEGRVGYLHDLAYIIDTMMTMDGEASGYGDYQNYEIYADFADLTQNEEENKTFDYQLAQNGYMSKARFLVRHLGLTEEEAAAMIQEADREKAAAQTSGGLFDEE